MKRTRAQTAKRQKSEAPEKKPKAANRKISSKKATTTKKGKKASSKKETEGLAVKGDKKSKKKDDVEVKQDDKKADPATKEDTQTKADATVQKTAAKKKVKKAARKGKQPEAEAEDEQQTKQPAGDANEAKGEAKDEGKSDATPKKATTREEMIILAEQMQDVQVVVSGDFVEFIAKSPEGVQDMVDKFSFGDPFVAFTTYEQLYPGKTSAIKRAQMAQAINAFHSATTDPPSASPGYVVPTGPMTIEDAGKIPPLLARFKHVGTVHQHFLSEMPKLPWAVAGNVIGQVQFYEDDRSLFCWPVWT